MRIDEPILEEDEPRVDAAALIEGVGIVARPLINPHDTDIRTRPERLFQPHHSIIPVRVRSARTRVYFQDAKLSAPNCSRELCTPIDRHLLSRHRIDSNVAAKKELVLVSHVEAEHSSILQEERPLFGNEYLERGQVKWFQIDLSVREIGVAR